jgi:uncharacterized protein (TIGR02145 family)
MVIPPKIIMWICLAAVFCAAQTISIGGIVKGADDVGISDATVMLEAAGLSTTTAADGSFTLTNDSITIRPGIVVNTKASIPVWIQNGVATITLSERSLVEIIVYNVAGRLVFSNKGTFGSGVHKISVPLQSTGIFLYSVSIGDNAYAFKSSPSGTVLQERGPISCGPVDSDAQAKTKAGFNDVISCFKKGQINYRDSIRTSDTSGIVVIMIPNAGDVKDADGNVYQSVKIGNQVWTVENLKTLKYNDGTPIPLVSDSAQWGSLTTGACCYYNNDAANKEKSGVLYNWHAVKTGKLAPTGWHVPVEAEWDTLVNYLVANGYTWNGVTTGGEIAKSLAVKTDWRKYSVAGTPGNNPGGNNKSGFSGHPGGCRNKYGSFSDLGSGSYWWSATAVDSTAAADKVRAINHSLLYMVEKLRELNWEGAYGACIREISN